MLFARCEYLIEAKSTNFCFIILWISMFLENPTLMKHGKLLIACVHWLFIKYLG